MEQNNKKLKYAIIILIILLVISASALTITLIYNHYAHTEPITVDVPGNIITPDGEDSSDTKTNPPPSESSSTSNGETTSGPDTSKVPDRSETASVSEFVPESTETETTSVSSTKASAIALHNRKSEDNTPFQVTNMFPGDAETKYYCIQVSYKGDIVVRCHADIRIGYEKLAEVLKVKIRLLDDNTTLNDSLAGNEILYDGLMRDMPKSLNHSLYTNTSTRSELYYEITAYLDTGVGNDYMDKELVGDFRWWVEEVDNLDPPQTGDTFYPWIWISIAAASLLIIIILLWNRRREEQYEQN